MSRTKETNAISTLLLILLLLFFAILGGLVSYLWVMSSYYNMPENTATLIVENAQFSVANFSYFNLTVLNPSNSASDLNISAFRLSVDATNSTYDVNSIEYPQSLPFLLAKGSRQTFKCIYDWSNIAGETVRVESLPANVSTISNVYTLPSAKLELTPIFDATQSVNYFSLRMDNPAESTSFHITGISMFGVSIDVNSTLPYALQNNQSVTFTCYRNWQNLWNQNVTITVNTAEGYLTSYTTNTLPGTALQLSDLKFDYSDTTYFNVTIHSSEDSTANAILTGLNLTLNNESFSLFTFPPLNITRGLPIATNQSLTLRCFWNWNLVRDENITIDAYTGQNFTVPALTVTTPPSVVWNVTDVKFDLDDLTRFWVNVTNTPSSTDNITVTAIRLNDQNTTLDHPSSVITSGTQTMLTCMMNWTSLIGQAANVTVFTAEGLNISTVVMIPSVQLKISGDIPVYGDLQGTTINATIPYFNVTVSNSINSVLNVTISHMVLEAGNTTQDLSESVLYPRVTLRIYRVDAGSTITFVCYSDYTQYFTSNTIKITVYTTEGIQATKTWQR